MVIRLEQGERKTEDLRVTRVATTPRAATRAAFPR
jgi:hypothetical protein